MNVDTLQRALDGARQTVKELESLIEQKKPDIPQGDIPKLAIVVGHKERSQGAVRADNGESEFTYNSKLAHMIEARAGDYGIDVRIFYRATGGYTNEIREVYRQVNEWGADASIELHFNADSPAATGTETWSSGSAKSLELAEQVQDAMVADLGLPDRGIKIRNSKNRGRGYLSLISGRPPAILIEPFFNENPDDLGKTRTEEQRRALARAILAGADRALESFAELQIAA